MDNKIRWYQRHANIALEWDSKKNTRTIQQSKSTEKAYWSCPNGHSWQAKIGNRTSGKNCPFCSGNRPSQQNNLQVANPQVLCKWDYKKNTISPTQILPKSTIQTWWKCDYGHSWMSSPHKMTNKKCKIGCPYCKGLMPSASNNIMKYQNIIKQWDYQKNAIGPENYTQGCGDKVNWKCQLGHSWNASVASRVYGTGCPVCRKHHSQVQYRIFSQILYYFIGAKFQYKIQDKCQVDIFIPQLNLSIQYDGGYWHNGKQQKDLIKNKKIKNKGIEIIRIRQFPLQRLQISDIVVPSLSSHIFVVSAIISAINIKYGTRITYGNNFINDQHFKMTYFSIVKDNAKKAGVVSQSLSKQWDYSKNGCFTPNNVSYGSGRKAWFKCLKGHQYTCQVRQKCKGKKCPFCLESLKSKYGDFIQLFWCNHNNLQDPSTISPKSHKFAYFSNQRGQIRLRRISDVTKGWDKKLKGNLD